jgi:citrate synthase
MKKELTAFWRNEDFTPEESQLLGQLMWAHQQSCFRDNASTLAVKIAADASGELGKAIAAGIATMGIKHAPVEETTRFLTLENPANEVDSILKAGRKVPGWGGTFQKDKPDLLWAEVYRLIQFNHGILYYKCEAVTAKLQKQGKLIYPNPSAYTACVAIILGIPPKVAPYLFIYGRITGWAQIAAGYLGA